MCDAYAAPMANSRLEEVVVSKSMGKKTSGAKVSNVYKNQRADTSNVNQQQQEPGSPVQVRKNFNETAFFFPDLRTDAEGNIEFSFTIPEALTKWKLMTLAHTKDMASGYANKHTITQKPLMVQPNAPCFMREGDKMEFSKIVNLGDSEVTGIASLELLDAATKSNRRRLVQNVFPNQYFTVAAGQSAAVKFPMEIPFNFNSAMSYRIVAKAEIIPMVKRWPFRCLPTACW